MKKRNLKHLFKIASISFIPPFLIYLPFVLKLSNLLFLELNNDGMLNIYRNWDGPSYLVIAKSLYNPKIIEKLLFSPLPETYFSAHFPLYPLLIKLGGIFMPIHQAGLLVNLLSSFALNLLFFEFIKNRTKSPYFLTLAFTLLPTRGFITRVIIAPEPLLLLFTLASLMTFKQKKYLISSILLALAALTKFQIVILAFAYFAVFTKEILQNKNLKKFVQNSIFLAIPTTTILILFYFYKQIYGKFFIYFEAQRVNNLSTSFPFSQFNLNATWIKSIWLEDLIFYFFLMFILVVKLYFEKKKKPAFFFFTAFYTLFLTIIPQRDITRFSLPLSPLFFYSFSSFFEQKYVKIAFYLLLLAIYFYTLNFILGNQAPVSDWSYFLGN